MSAPIVTFRAFAPADVLAISLQLSQSMEIGLTERPGTIGEGEALAAAGPAWTAQGRAGEILCCAGFAQQYPGRQATAWAMLAAGIGAAHLAVTRFARARIANSPLRRIEAIVLARHSECAWARLVGMKPAAVLDAWGPRSERHILFERVRP